MEAEALKLMEEEAEALRLRKRMQEAKAILSYGSTTKLMLPHHWEQEIFGEIIHILLNDFLQGGEFPVLPGFGSACP